MQFVAKKSGYHFTLLCFSSISPAPNKHKYYKYKKGGGGGGWTQILPSCVASWQRMTRLKKHDAVLKRQNDNCTEVALLFSGE